MNKVCHMTSGHKNNDIRIFHKECTSLAKAGYKVYLVASGESSNKNGVHLIGIGEPPKSRFKRMTLVTKNIYKKAFDLDADIYHLHDPELLPYGLKLKKKGKKVIFDSHEIYSAQILEKKYMPKRLRKIIAILYKTYESHVIKKLDAVIIPCTIGGENVFSFAKKTVFIDNTPLISELSDKYQERDISDCRSICYTGGLTYDRGIIHLIEAAYKAGVKLILAGNFMPPSFGDEIKKMPGHGNVEYKGYLDRTGIVNVYRESAIGMCTILSVGQYNKGDNFPTKVYEYMSMGIPVILTDSPFARRVLEKYEFGICVQPDNSDDIASAISFLISNPVIAKQMGEIGRKAILELFNWDIEEVKLLQLYRELNQ